MQALDKDTFISAGAGTGKTQQLVERFIELLAQGKAEVSEIAAITFTEKAAKEMKDRIRERCEERHKRDLENSRVGTIHGLCARLIRENPIEIGIDPASDILDESEAATLLGKYVNGHILDLINKEDPDTINLVSEYGFKDTKNIIRTLIRHRLEIDQITVKKGTGGGEMDKRLIELNRYIFSIYKAVRDGYEAYKKKKALLDFNDLIIYAKKLLKENKAVRSYYHKIIKYLLVDEFQDTDFHQREIIFSLAGKNTRLFIVGDSKQSIYRFRGADVSVFEDTRRLLEKKGDYIELNTNMRSLPQNIDFINNLFGRVMGRERDNKEDYECAYTGLQAGRKEDIDKPTIQFLNVPVDDEDNAEKIRRKEAGLIAGKILELQGNGIQFKDIAVLFRAMTDVKLYEDALRGANIPYYVIAGSGFFARQEIKDILNYLKIIDNPKDYIAMAGVMRSPMIGLDDNELYRWSKDKQPPPLYAELKDKITISRLIQEIIRRTNYKAVLASQYMGEQKISNVDKLIDTARRFERKGIFTLTDFIEYLNELVVNEAREGEAAVAEEESNVVKLMTIHKAKGLEFPAVIIPDVHRRARPVWSPVLFDRKFNWLGIKVKDKDGERAEPNMRKLIREEIERKELAESKRLLYVASTRARDYLIYSGRFEDIENTWAGWLSGFMGEAGSVPPGHPCEARVGVPRGLAPHRNPACITPEIMRQVEPIRPGVMTRVTASDSGSYISRFGIEVHRFFKNWDFGETDIPEFAEKFVKDPIYREIKDAVEIKKELPITYTHNGQIIEGVIDLLYKKKDSNWVILDYKTDKTTENIKEYERQLARYTLGVEKVLGIKPEKAVIYFLTLGTAVELPQEIIIQQ